VIDLKSDILPFVSPIVSVAALALAAMSYSISRKTAQLNQDREARGRPNIVISPPTSRLFKAFGGLNFYSILLTISNISDAGNSIKSADIRIGTKSSDGLESTIRISSSNQVDDVLDRSGQKQLELPVNIPAHSTVSGWAYFQIKSEILKDKSIHSYTAVVEDAHGAEFEHTIGFIAEAT